METQNHLGDARDSKYISQIEHDELYKLADRAIGASTRLMQYLQNCKEWPGSPDPRTKNLRTKNPGTKNPRTKNPGTKNTGTKNPERRTKNEP